MKKLIFILIIGSIFLSCQKDEIIEPAKQLLSIDAYVNTIDVETMSLTFIVQSDEVYYTESKTCSSSGESIVFKKDFYVTPGKDLTLQIISDGNYTIGLYGYTIYGKRTYKIYENPVKISLTGNDFKNVIIE